MHTSGGCTNRAGSELRVSMERMLGFTSETEGKCLGTYRVEGKEAESVDGSRECSRTTSMASLSSRSARNTREYTGCSLTRGQVHIYG